MSSPDGQPDHDLLATTVARAWRALTGPARAEHREPGEPCLIACSGGADSMALAEALRPRAESRAMKFVAEHTGRRFVIAHIVHDLRAPATAHADRDLVQQYAHRWQLPFAQRSIAVKALPGNAEANARKLRYAALRDIAIEHNLRFVATAHHQRDQAESVLLAMLRGAGPHGLSGIAPRRWLGIDKHEAQGIRLIRPMLAVPAALCRDYLERRAVSWCEDHTNADTNLSRNRLRHRVLPLIEQCGWDVDAQLAAMAAVQRETARHLARLARRVGFAGPRWPRATLRSLDTVVLCEWARTLAMKHGASPDSIGQAALHALARYARSPGTDPHTFYLGGIKLLITAHHAEVVYPAPPQA